MQWMVFTHQSATKKEVPTGEVNPRSMVERKYSQITLALFLHLLSALWISQGALGQTASLITTITNPSPAVNDRFGVAVASLGTHGLVIGAAGAGISNSGEAYLLNTNGTLLTTFTNPTPEVEDYFAQAVATLGSDRVLIAASNDGTGAPGAGAVYLFHTNGTLLTTLTNPVPGTNDFFGTAIAAVGSTRILVGASYDDTSGDNVGTAYLFSTNGALLVTFTNPPPSLGNNNFGQAAAALGEDRVLIGSIGRVHLFSTNGNLLHSFNDPGSSFGSFGNLVTTVGSDQVLVGAIFNNTGASDAGAAFLFNTNGALITTFTNPTPAMSDYFGSALAAVGSDRVVIGAVFDNTGATDTGAAYLFRTNGTLLTTITNPTPVVSDYFSRSIVAVGTDRVLISADYDNTGDLDSGAAYLFSLPAPAAPPTLAIQRTTTNTVVISWPSTATGFALQQNTNLTTTNWITTTNTVSDNGQIKSVVVNPLSGSQFYRLFKP